MRGIDLAPLTAPIPDAAVQEWRARMLAADVDWARLDRTDSRLAVVGRIGVVVLVVACAGLEVALVFQALADPSQWTQAVIFGALMIGIAIAVVALGRRGRKPPTRWQRWARIDAFARANRLIFSPRDAEPGYQGLLFRIGSRRGVDEHVRTPDGSIDMGGFWTNASKPPWTFVAMRLERRVPNMMLQARANRMLLGGFFPFTGDQVLHLEGDFDKWFTLYCPREYETDALQIFTPDLMAVLIDDASAFDVEIVDDWLFAYLPRPLDMSLPATYQRLFHVVDTVGAKTLTQTDTYRDDRSAAAQLAAVGPAPVVALAAAGDPAARPEPVAAPSRTPAPDPVGLIAPQGARLRRRGALNTILAILLFIAIVTVFTLPMILLNHR